METFFEPYFWFLEAFLVCVNCMMAGGGALFPVQAETPSVARPI